MKHSHFFLILLCFIVSMIFIFPPKKSKKITIPHQSKSIKDNLSSVNYHIREVSNNIQREKMKVEDENSYLSHSEGSLTPMNELPREISIYASDEQPFAQKMENIDHYAGATNFKRSAEEKIREFLEKMEYQKDYNEKYREEFKQALIENARRAGYILKIDDQLRVLQIRSIRSPTSSKVSPSSSK